MLPSGSLRSYQTTQEPARSLKLGARNVIARSLSSRTVGVQVSAPAMPRAFCVPSVRRFYKFRTKKPTRSLTSHAVVRK